MKIAVLVSGGVDSSVALHLLKEQGHDLTAFYLKIWLEDELSFLGTCPWQEDLTYVEAVCKQQDVPLQVVSLQQEYWQKVVTYTIAQIRMGNTPNPDILCNQHIKFGSFYEAIDDSFDKVATGHYAQVHQQGQRVGLFMTPDPVKDQTYFLARLSQQQLARALFPIGHLTKPQVRQYAQRYDLPTQLRKDSQGICFLGKLKFSEFLKYHCGQQQGDLVEIETGNVLGSHSGFWFYTIGQRQGLGLAGGPWYVVAKHVESNTVFISRSYHAPDKVRDTFSVSSFNWISGQKIHKKEAHVKIRHGHHLHACSLDWQSNDKAIIKLAQRDQGIASGQFAVFYDGQECIASAVIE